MSLFAQSVVKIVESGMVGSGHGLVQSYSLMSLSYVPVSSHVTVKLSTASLSSLDSSPPFGITFLFGQIHSYLEYKYMELLDNKGVGFYTQLRMVELKDCWHWSPNHWSSMLDLFRVSDNLACPHIVAKLMEFQRSHQAGI